MNIRKNIDPIMPPFTSGIFYNYTAKENKSNYNQIYFYVVEI